MHTIVLSAITKYFIINGQKFTLFTNATGIFEQHKTYAITGPSGSGKSTLLHLIAHLIVPDEGRLFFNDTPYPVDDTRGKFSLIREQTGIVFQQPYVIAELSVLENIMVPGLLRGQEKLFVYEKAKALLEEIGLSSFAFAPVKALSGGQQQRVALARAFFNEPAFLLLDEPTSSLDASTAKHIIDLIFSFHRTFGSGIILCTHDERIVELMDHRVVIENGTVTFR